MIGRRKNMSVHFKPDMKPYKNLGSFRIWCQKVLPAVYDESLSYYEVLCKLKDYLNEVIENVDGLYEDMDALYNAYGQLEDYVNNYFDNLDVQAEINNKLDVMASDGSLSTLIAPFVEALLPDEVASRILAVVESQLPAVVRVQLPPELASQLPAEVAAQIPNLVTAWLNLHIVQPVEVIIDDSLTISGAAADAKTVGDAISELKSALTPIVPGWNYGYKTNTGATGGTSGTDRQYSDPILCPEGSTVYYVGETDHGTVAGICFYDINMNFISGISNSGTTGTEQTATAPSNSWYCIISTKTTILNQSYAHVRNSMVETIKNITDDFAKKAFYVAPNGNDSSGRGTSDAPYKTINKAVQMGADVVFLTAGVYEQPSTTNIQNKNGFAMYVIPSAPSTSTDHKPRAIYENAYTLAVSADAGSGLLAGMHTFAETSNWYKVFVSQTLPISPSGTQSVTYNAILWESDESDPTKDLKLVPKLTLAECQAATGSFYYDHSAGKVYINPSGTINNAKYKYLRFESDGALFTINNCQNVHIEDFEIKHSAGNGIVVTNSSNVTFKNCGFTHSAYRDGLMINRSNVDCVNCEALKETADGFGIANQGQGNFYNCHAHHNYDDGISHHDGSIGFVDGGYFHHNGKGGVASPYSGSNVNVKNAICEANAYGIYAGSGSDVCMICNCVLKDNTTSGILNVGYNPLYVFNCIFSGNTVNTSGQGTTTILTND